MKLDSNWVLGREESAFAQDVTFDSIEMSDDGSDVIVNYATGGEQYSDILMGFAMDEMRDIVERIID